MLRALRRKLIAAAMFSLAVVLFLILGGVNLVGYQKLVSDADAILDVLGSNGGAFPLRERPGEPGFQPFPFPRPDQFPVLTVETPYESRYFSVLVDGEGEVIQADTGQIAAVDGTDAAEYALTVWRSGKERGFLEHYRYLRCQEAGGSRIIFLDCGRNFSNFYSTLFASGALSLLGLGAVLVLLVLLSRRIIRPVAESYEKQKRFITDAGHELKTPLTIISADTDLAEMECGENQWLTDIRRQAQRLTGLTQDLIYLSRMEEDRPGLTCIPFPLSDVVEEMAGSFQAPARSQGKKLTLAIQPMLTFTGDEKAIRQLVSILLDNALKYAPPGGALSVQLERRGRNLRLAVTNTTAEPVERGELEHLFDRFYRTDRSRSTETGGYGLGLSIARSVVTAHRGRIRAESTGGHTLTMVVTLPAQ